MDVVYICRQGENEELRYSLRSIEKNLSYDNVWVVGYKPSWYSGKFISIRDTSNKFENIRKALKLVCDTAEVADNFIFMHDDIYIIKQIEELKPMFSGSLTQKVEELKKSKMNSSYFRKIVDVHNHLKSKGFKDILNYEVHVPMPMNKQKLSSVIDNRVLERSLYGNTFIEDAVEIPRDVKFYDRYGKKFPNSYNYLSEELPFASSHDLSFAEMKEYLDGLFPEPSQFEHP